MSTRESQVFPIGDGANAKTGVTSVAISPDDRFVAAGSHDTVVRIWDIATRTLVDRFRGHGDSVQSVAFTPDGKGLVSCSRDKTLKYLGFSVALSGAYETGGQFSKCMLDFTGHRGPVRSVAISHDGQWIVSGSDDCSVQFWDRHGRMHLMLQGHHDSGTWLSLQVFRWSNIVMICEVNSVDLSPTGGYLATGSSDRRMRVCKSLPTRPVNHLSTTYLPTHLSSLLFRLLIAVLDAQGAIPPFNHRRGGL